MTLAEARVRHRGFFLHSTDGSEPETGDHEHAEGFQVRVRVEASATPRQFSGVGRGRGSGQVAESRPEIRSGSVTGSRQRAHLPR